MHWMELALCYSGLFALCVAMPKHYRQIWSSAPSEARQLLMRTLGWCALILSFAASVWVNGWSFGPVEWIGMLAMTGLALTIFLPYTPRLALGLALAALVIAPVWPLL